MLPPLCYPLSTTRFSSFFPSCFLSPLVCLAAPSPSFHPFIRLSRHLTLCDSLHQNLYFLSRHSLSNDTGLKNRKL
ncbi:hypothetical protein V8C40DRAFT_163914 [Trichoderma camerunense]